MSLHVELENGSFTKINDLCGFVDNYSEPCVFDRIYYVDESQGSENNELIYKRGDGDVVMSYYNTGEEVDIHKFLISEYSSQNPPYTVQFNEKKEYAGKNYKVDEKYRSVIGKDEYCQSALISFEDTASQITALGPHCFAYCNNLTSVSVPAIKNIETEAFLKCPNIEYLNISSVQSLAASTFSSMSKIKKVYVNSSKLLTIDNGYGNDGEIIVRREQHEATPRRDVLVAVTKNAHYLSNDYVYSLSAWLLNYGDFYELHLKNLHVEDTNIFSSNMKKLSVLDIDNEYSKSFSNTADHLYALPADPNIKALVFSPDLKKWQYCGHKVSYISCNTITAFNSLIFQYQSLTGMDISNDVFHTLDHAMLIDSLSTTVHGLIKNSDAVSKKPDKYINRYPMLTAINRYVIQSYSNDIELKYVKLVKTTGFSDSAINKKITMPELISVENNAFSNCRPYELHFPKLSSFSDSMFTASGPCGSTKLLIDVPNLTSIGSYCFQNWEYISKYDFPDNVNRINKIGKYAFDSNKSLISIYFNECTSFGTNCFRNCWELNTLCCGSISQVKLSQISADIGLKTNEKMLSCYCSDGMTIIDNT